MAHLRLGDLLISAGLITTEQLEHALRQQKITKNRYTPLPTIIQ